jgi:hypothetical protein
MTGKVSEENLQVMRSWLVAEWAKPQGSMSSVDIEKFILEVENNVLKIPDLELVEKVRALVNDSVKLCRLLAWRWQHREIYMKDFGPWRTVGDALPLEACKHSIVEAAEFIRDNPQGLPDHLEKWNGPDSNARYIQCVVKLRSISNISAFIQSRDLLSILVVESKQRGRECCDPRRYSSEEGSHRAIALSLAGYETISAWVGNPLGALTAKD